MHHIVLYDFAIHWFDMVRCVFDEREAQQVFSQLQRARGQELPPH
jgi:predicted dehydrogenase